jgi:hypothetical protein
MSFTELDTTDPNSLISLRREQLRVAGLLD